MYRSTGVRLLESFRKHKIPGALLVCHEQKLGAEIAATPPRLLTYDLDRSTFLHEWLAKNRDIIPGTLGGKARKCDCPEPDDPFGEHRERCCWSWFNKNASRWFRKIVSLDHALTLGGFDLLIWVDSDCRFLRAVPAKEIEAWFEGASVFYLKGPRRAVIESGIIGFRFDPGGRAVLESAIRRYRTGEFRQDPRWDDGYQFQLAIEQHPEIPAKDWARADATSGRVVPGSRMGAYISHSKGAHRASGITE